jgi:hypothetical protein
MGRFKTHEERQRKIMKNKELKKQIKALNKGAKNGKELAKKPKEIEERGTTNPSGTT